MGFALVLIVIAFLVFGGDKLGSLGKGLGEGIRNFKDALKEEDPKKPPDSPNT